MCMLAVPVRSIVKTRQTASCWLSVNNRHFYVTIVTKIVKNYFSHTTYKHIYKDATRRKIAMRIFCTIQNFDIYRIRRES